MAEALYRKYRPNTFDDVVGQEHIERTLKNAIEQDKISHAYLFCGPRGTGKTTMARILSKALLCEKGPTIEPDGTCEECLEIASGIHPDVYELDAASRTGVENVREEIINRVHYAPTRGSHKIYIIDEVHMLSTAAFNALLKTLEEPPEHVVFILCTTDPQKVPDTIHSRCQRFDFHRLSVDEIVTRLGAVCVQEDVEFEAEALELIAHQAEGGMRNALTSLEQLAAFGEGRVTLDGAHRILGSLDNEGLSEIVQALGRHDAATCFTWVSDYVETGADIAQFVQDLAEHFRNLYLLSLTDADVEIAVSSSTRASMEQDLEFFGPERLSRALGVLGDLMKDLRATTNSRLTFEIALTRLLRPESDITMESLAERLEELELKMLSMPASPAFAPAPAAVQPVMSQTVSVPIAEASPVPQVTSVPQPAPAPQPAPVVQAPSVVPAASTPANVAPMSATSVQEPTPAQSEPAVQAQNASAPGAPARFNYSDPAALQRMWSTVTGSLRKSNPARGVLFMGAKVEPNAQIGGVNIVFSPDSSFAYSAAQKKEVKDLLAQAFVTVAGGSVPFQIVLAGDHTLAQSAPQPAPSAIPPAQRASQSTSAPQPVAQAPVAQLDLAADALQARSFSSSAPVMQTQPSEPVPPVSGLYEDESPFWDDEAPSVLEPPMTASVDQGAPVSASASEPVQRPQADVSPQPSMPASAPTNPVSAPPMNQELEPEAQSFSAVSQAVAPDPATPATAGSEEDRLKQMLTNTFGEGVKFDTM